VILETKEIYVASFIHSFVSFILSWGKSFFVF